MNEKLQYATMLEIPVNTASVTYKPAKRRRGGKRKIKNPDAVKEELLLKVNSGAENVLPETVSEMQEEVAETALAETAMEIPAEISAETPMEYSSASVHKKAKKPLFKFTAVTAELVAVVALLAVIFLTNAFYTDSAINVFMRKVFSPSAATETVHEKTYDEFAPVINFNGETALSDGVITCSGSGSVYAPADGTVSSVIQEENGTYTINIAHSAVFSTTLSGLSYAYLGIGDKVYGNIPVGYVSAGEFTACFNSGDALITDYTLENNAVLWAV